MALQEVIYHFFRDATTKILKLRPKDGVPGTTQEPVHVLFRDATTGALKTRGPSTETTGATDAFGRQIVKTAIGHIFRDATTGVMKARVPIGVQNCVCNLCEEPDVLMHDFYDAVTGPLQTCDNNGVKSDTVITQGIVHRCMRARVTGTPSQCACFDGDYGPLQRTPCKDRLIAGNFTGAFHCPPLPIPANCDEGGGITGVCGGVTGVDGHGDPNALLPCDSCTHCSDSEGVLPAGERPNLCCYQCAWTSWSLSASSDPCYEYVIPASDNGLQCWQNPASTFANRYYPACPGFEYNPNNCDGTFDISLGASPSATLTRQSNFGCLDEIVDAGIEPCIDDKTVFTGQPRQKRFTWTYDSGGSTGTGSCNRCTDCLYGVADHTRFGLGTSPVRRSCGQYPPLCAHMAGNQNQTMEIVVHAFCYGVDEDGETCPQGHIWAHLHLNVQYRDYRRDGSPEVIVENFNDECDGNILPAGDGCATTCQPGSGAGNFDCCPPESVVDCPDTCSDLDLGRNWNTPNGPCDTGAKTITARANRFSTDCTGKAVPLSMYLIPAGKACSPGTETGRTIPMVSQEPYFWSGGVYPPGAGDTYLGPIINLTLFGPDSDSSCQYISGEDILTASCPGYDASPIP